MFKIFKKCHHVYEETELIKRGWDLGVYKLFVCNKCGKEKWFYIPILDSLFLRQKINNKYNKKNKYTLIRTITREGDDWI